MSVSERQGSKAIDTQQNNQKGLNTMHNQGKDSGIRHIYPIKHHQSDDSKVPGSCPVGRGNNDCKRSADKHHQPGKETKVLRKLEAIESYIEMIEIA